MRSKCRAFTLIELLVVVAVIAVLVAIAVPNLMDARTRSQVARVRSEHRTLALALESYFMDNMDYPSANNNGSVKWLRWMTTPQAYITRADMDDPFTGDNVVYGKDWNLSYRTYRYYGFNEQGYLNADSKTGAVIKVYTPPGDLRVYSYALFSHGPDRVRSKGSNGKTFIDNENLFFPDKFVELIYDPSNGTISNGELLRSGGEPVGRPKAALRMVLVR